MSRHDRVVLHGPFLVGVDGDGRSDHAVAVALELAGRYGAEVELVHAVSPSTLHGPLADPDGDERRLVAARAKLARHLDGLGDGPLSEKLLVLPGKPGRVLLERAREIGAGLLLLGPHRRRGVVDHGSTARAVLSQSSCPVWTQARAPEPLRRVLAPLDLSEDSRAALEVAIDLAVRHAAVVVAVASFVGPDFAYPPDPEPTMPTYVVDEKRAELRRQVEALLEETDWRGVGHELVFDESEPAELIVRTARFGDVIVMATHGRGAFAAAVLGSVTYTVLREAEVAVLAVRHPARVGQP